MTADTERHGLGIALRILSGVLFTAMVVCIKMASDRVPLGEIVFFRSFFAMIPLVIFLWLRNEFPGGLKTTRSFGHILRTAIGTVAMFTSFAAIARLPIAEATLIGHLAPVFTAIAGVILLSERFTIWRAGGIILGFTGVLVLVWPELGNGIDDPRRFAGYALGIATAILTALSLIMVRSLNRTENPGAIAFYFALVTTLAGAASLPWGWVMPDAFTTALLILSGLFGGIAHIMMTLAFRHAEASRLAPFEYVALIWPVLADLLIFRLPLASSFIIAMPLVLSGAAIAAMEKRR